MDSLKAKMWGKNKGDSETGIEIGGDDGGGDGGVLAASGVENNSMCKSLSFKKRLIGYLVCSICSVVASVFGLVLLFTKKTSGGAAFGVLYTGGTILAIMATGFFMGPLKQLKKILNPHRLVSFLILVGCMIATLALAFTKPNMLILIIICAVAQWLAYVWYSLSYIPMAQSCVKKCCTKACGM